MRDAQSAGMATSGRQPPTTPMTQQAERLAAVGGHGEPVQGRAVESDISMDIEMAEIPEAERGDRAGRNSEPDAPMERSSASFTPKPAIPGVAGEAF